MKRFITALAVALTAALLPVPVANAGATVAVPVKSKAAGCNQWDRWKSFTMYDNYGLSAGNTQYGQLSTADFPECGPCDRVGYTKLLTTGGGWDSRISSIYSSGSHNCTAVKLVSKQGHVGYFPGNATGFNIPWPWIDNTKSITVYNPA